MHPTRTHTTRRPLLALLIAVVALAPAVGTAQSGYTGVVTIRVTLDDGTVVAAGDLDDGRLDVEVLSGLSDSLGSAEFVLADGTVVSGEVMFGEDGQITVMTEDFDGFQGFVGSLEEFLAGYGTEVTVEFDDSIDDDRDNMDDDMDDDRDDDMDDDDRDGMDDDRDGMDDDMDDDRDDDDMDDHMDDDDMDDDDDDDMDDDDDVDDDDDIDDDEDDA